MPGLGHDHLHVGVRDVAGEVLASPSVVEADDARSDEAGTADRDRRSRACCREAPPTCGGRSGRSLSRSIDANLRLASKSSAWVITLSPNLRAGRGPMSGSRALRLSSSAAFAAGSGAWPGAGAAATRLSTSGESSALGAVTGRAL